MLFRPLSGVVAGVRRMGGIFGTLLLVFGGAAHPAQASPRIAVPFVDAYRDGHALVLWGDPTPEDLARRLRRIRQSGARSLSIPYFGCQSSIRSSDVGACAVRLRTPAIEQARQARLAGFESIYFIPIVATPDWQWRGFFDPVDVDEWFRTYSIWIRGIAREASALGMTELVVASEMTLLYRYESRWSRLLAEVRAEFPGALVMTVNWGDTEHGFWSDADAIGVSAYYPLSQKDDPTQGELDHAWRARRDEFLALSRRWDRSIHLTEVGYASRSSAAKTPWAGEPGDRVDVALQARCYEAFRKAWQAEPALVRANFWATEGQEASDTGSWLGFEPLGKPAEAVLRAFFEGRAALAETWADFTRIAR